MSPIVTIQKRMMELGRFRPGGEKSEKKPGRKLDHWRVTSASRALLEAIAEQYGGKVTAWENAPDEGYWQVYTETHEVHGVFPPIFSDIDGSPALPLSQFFEEWSGGGAQRRCDGVTETLSGKPCLCAAAVAKNGEDARVCKPTTRLSFMLPNIPGLGVWRAESKGWNAAAELPGTAQVLQQAAAEGRFIPMVLRLEPRSAKRGGQTRRFVVPVIDLPQVTMTQLAAGEVPLVLNAPVRVAERPALPAAPASPSDDGARFANDSGEPPMGEPPALPGEQDGDKTGPGEEAAREPDRAGSGQAGGEPAEQERAHDEAGRVAGASEFAQESDVTGLLEIAAQVGPDVYEKMVAAIVKEREAHGGRVRAEWLVRQSARLLERAGAAA